jgi:hypothetical protein
MKQHILTPQKMENKESTWTFPQMTLQSPTKKQQISIRGHYMDTTFLKCSKISEPNEMKVTNCVRMELISTIS